MSSSVPIIQSRAIAGSGSSAAELFVSGKSAVDEENWFSESARALYRFKPGTVLHQTTRLGDERLCQRYAAGHVKPPAFFLRTLLRSEHGAQWLGAVMDGCSSQWWADLQRACRVGQAAIGELEK